MTPPRAPARRHGASGAIYGRGAAMPDVSRWRRTSSPTRDEHARRQSSVECSRAASGRLRQLRQHHIRIIVAEMDPARGARAVSSTECVVERDAFLRHADDLSVTAINNTVTMMPGGHRYPVRIVGAGGRYAPRQRSRLWAGISGAGHHRRRGRSDRHVVRRAGQTSRRSMKPRPILGPHDQGPTLQPAG